MNTVNFIINGILQVAIFSVIPLIWWSSTARKTSGFFEWIGLKKIETEDKKKIILIFILTIILLLVPAIFIIPNLVSQSKMATSQFVGQGTSALIPALIYSFVTTGLSEEIFFRGFIGKRLINKFGLKTGNLAQGVLFGLLHGAMFVSIAGIGGAVLIILITGTAGCLMGYIDEGLSKGSIVPSWLLHGCANLCASIIAMYTLI